LLNKAEKASDLPFLQNKKAPHLQSAMPNKKTDIELTFKEACLKLASYCAYQERCEWEVVQKLNDLAVSEEDKEKVIAYLQKEKYLNEARFAEYFAGGKFRLKGWGKMKIAQALAQKRVAKHLVYQGLASIDDNDYREKLYSLLQRKKELLPELEEFKQKQKLFAFASSKGFEPHLIWETIKDLD